MTLLTTGRLAGPLLAGPLLAGLLLAAGPAAAQADAACARMKDAAGCACALATGGTVSGRSWARGSDRTAFESCLSARGAASAASRPATIRARL